MAVRMDKLTYKAQEALQGAQELARQLGNPQIEAGPPAAHAPGPGGRPDPPPPEKAGDRSRQCHPGSR